MSQHGRLLLADLEVGLSLRDEGPASARLSPPGAGWGADVASVDTFQSARVAAQTVAKPAPLTQALYLQEPGDTAAISVNDIHQGQIGDCFLLAAIGELALTHPGAIPDMIRQNPNSSETVTLYVDSNNHLPSFDTTAFTAGHVMIINLFAPNGVNNGANQNVVGTKKEVWPQVLEKAYATLAGGYNAIANGGSPILAMEALTGHAATGIATLNLRLDMLKGFVAAGDLITMDTPKHGRLPFSLINGHTYMFEGLTTTAGVPMVQLGNPWGVSQPSLIPFAQLSRGISEVDVGRFA